MLEDILAYIEGAHPIVYFGLLMCAGLGLPVSEDALAIFDAFLTGSVDTDIAEGRWPLTVFTGFTYVCIRFTRGKP